MAIEKVIEFENGTVANYHKISAIHVSPYEIHSAEPIYDNDGNETGEYKDELRKGYYVNIYVSSFATQNIRQRNIELYLNSFKHLFSVDFEKFDNASLFELGYSLIKTLPQFEDAIDV